jgi:hypothetical protein
MFQQTDRVTQHHESDVLLQRFARTKGFLTSADRGKVGKKYHMALINPGQQERRELLAERRRPPARTALPSGGSYTPRQRVFL